MKTYKYHYVYRITHTQTNKYYYGSRSTNLNPHEEIGKKYFSNFSEKWFQQDQKENPQNYKYKVVKIFETNREDAILLESKLHYRFDVKNHNKFYNKANQAPKGFDTTGKVFSTGKVVVFDSKSNKRVKINVSEINHTYQTVLSKNKVSVIDLRNGITSRINLCDMGENHVGVSKGMVTIYDESLNCYRNITKDEYKSGKFKTATTGMVTVRDKEGEIKNITKKEFGTSSIYNHISKGTVSIIDKTTGEKKRVSKLEYEKNPNFVNCRSKRINIYNSKNNLVYETYGDFKVICELNKLPFGELKKSYQQNGKRIYSEKPPRKVEYSPFRFWHAKILD